MTSNIKATCDVTVGDTADAATTTGGC